MSLSLWGQQVNNLSTINRQFTGFWLLRSWGGCFSGEWEAWWGKAGRDFVSFFIRLEVFFLFCGCVLFCFVLKKLQFIFPWAKTQISGLCRRAGYWQDRIHIPRLHELSILAVHCPGVFNFSYPISCSMKKQIFARSSSACMVPYVLAVSMKEFS